MHPHRWLLMTLVLLWSWERSPAGASGAAEWVTTERLVLDKATAAKANGDVWISPDGKRIAYLVKEKDFEYFLVDGEAQKRFSRCRTLNLVRDIFFFANGRRHLFVGEQDEKQAVVVDGVEQDYYDAVDRRPQRPPTQRTLVGP